MIENISAPDSGICSHDRVCLVVQGLLRSAQAKGWTDEALGTATGLKARRIKAYRVEGKEPSLSAAMSLGVVLGPSAINTMLSLIGYSGAHPLDEGDAEQPFEIIATLMDDVNTIVQAGKDNRFDHIERPAVKAAADHIIATLVPISSAGDAE